MGQPCRLPSFVAIAGHTLAFPDCFLLNGIGSSRIARGAQVGALPDSGKGFDANQKTTIRSFLGTSPASFRRISLQEISLRCETLDLTFDLLGRRDVAPALLPRGTPWMFAGGTVSGI